MKLVRIFAICVIIILVISLSVEGQQVSTKLDLDEESREETNSRGHHSRSNSTSGTSGGNSRVSPKIEGVRVTVDAGGDKKQTKETESDKESVEIVDNKNTKRVGIHTDITFEITDDKTESNGTSSEQADNDASVPIFKGRGRGDPHRPHYSPRRPYNPKIHIEYPDVASPPVYTNNGRDHYSGGHNVPIYPSRSDDSGYRNIDRWASVVPIMNSWTTERSSYYVPSSRSHQRPDVNYRSSPSDFNNYHRSHQQASAVQPLQPQYYNGQQQVGGGGPCVCVYDSEWNDSNTLKARSFRSAIGSPSQSKLTHAAGGIRNVQILQTKIEPSIDSIRK